MEVGLIVKFKEGLYPDEEEALYKVIEDNGDRVMLEFICNMPLPPQSVALAEELEPVGMADA